MTDARAALLIEAPGKRATLSRLMRRVVPRTAATALATRGHFCGFPSRLTPLGFGPDGDDVGRVPDPGRLAALCRDLAALAPDRVWLATDDDDEGDVIAWDAATHLPLPRRALRVRLSALTEGALSAALAEASPPEATAAAPGRTRAMLDRLLGAACARRGFGGGRVLTPLLEAASAGAFRRRRLMLPVRFETGEEAEAELWLPPDRLDRLARAVAASGPLLLPWRPDVVRRHVCLHGGELLIGVSETLGLALADCAEAMQRLYESGALSYWRSLGREMPGHAAAPESGRPRSAHPAPHPLREVPLCASLSRLGADEAVLTVIARLQAEAMARAVVEVPAGVWRAPFARLGFDDVPPGAVACRLELSRRFPWQGRRRVACAPSDPWAVERAVLRTMLELGLGRPSTWVDHVRRLRERALIDASGRLTGLGGRWLDAAPAPLTSAALSRALEEACRTPVPGEDPAAPWRARFVAACASFPRELAAIVEPVFDEALGPSRAAPPSWGPTEGSGTDPGGAGGPCG